jgi:hypothetical protein
MMRLLRNWRFIFAIAALAFATNCSDDLVCLTDPKPLFLYSVRSLTGADLTNTALFVVRRLEGNPPVAVDSVQGRVGVATLAFQKQPGDYRITVSHEGFVSQEILATAEPADLGGCGPGAKRQSITVTLIPQSSSELSRQVVDGR